MIYSLIILRRSIVLVNKKTKRYFMSSVVSKQTPRELKIKIFLIKTYEKKL